MFESINSKNINFIILVLVCVMLLFAYRLHMVSPEATAWRGLFATSTGIMLLIAIFNYSRLLKITEAPTSTIASAAQGYIELHGVASTKKPFKTPYHNIPCVWYRAYVYANRIDPETKEFDKKLLSFTESKQVFQLRDESGECAVNPQGAEVIFMEKRTQIKNEHRYVEEYLPSGKSLYLLGHLDTLHHYNTTEAIDKDTTDLIVSWKKNPSKLLARFDQDYSGQIDMDEWEVARKQARQEVEARHAMLAHNQEVTLAKPKNGQLFLISALSPQALRQQYRRWSLINLLVFTILLIAFIKIS
jgi:hypothetical protein